MSECKCKTAINTHNLSVALTKAPQDPHGYRVVWCASCGRRLLTVQLHPKAPTPARVAKASASLVLLAAGSLLLTGLLIIAAFYV